jgi:hypothetical protein
MNKVFENEQMFEKVNAKLAQATSSLTPADFPQDFVLELYCECVNKACYERVSIAYNEYKQLKADKLTFVVKPEHYLPEFERLTKQTINYWVIVKKLEKLGKQFEI